MRDEDLDHLRENEDEDGNFVVGKIKSINDEGKYLVSWKGYDSSEDTWEPFENVCHTEAFEKFRVI